MTRAVDVPLRVASALVRRRSLSIAFGLLVLFTAGEAIATCRPPFVAVMGSCVCPAGTIPLDGVRCARITPWERGDLPSGTTVAIRPARVYVPARVSAMDWNRWLQLGPDNLTLISSGRELTSNALFRVETFSDSCCPEAAYHFPWFMLQARNGKYVTFDGGRAALVAAMDAASEAIVFLRGNGGAGPTAPLRFLATFGTQWGNRVTRLATLRSYPEYPSYFIGVTHDERTVSTFYMDQGSLPFDLFVVEF